jgi:hypothetical protein
MDKTGKRAVGDLQSEILQQIAVDYIVNDMACKDAVAKYNITPGAYYEIRDRMGLIKKREDYRKKILDKAIDKLANKKSKILVDAVDVLLKHVEGVKNLQQNEMPVLPTSIVNDIIKIAALISNEKRLDEGKATENIGVKVIVEMPDIMVVGYTKKPDIATDAQVVEPQQEQIEEKKVEAVVKVEQDIVGIL